MSAENLKWQTWKLCQHTQLLRDSLIPNFAHVASASLATPLCQSVRCTGGHWPPSTLHTHCQSHCITSQMTGKVTWKHTLIKRAFPGVQSVLVTQAKVHCFPKWNLNLTKNTVGLIHEKQSSVSGWNKELSMSPSWHRFNCSTNYIQLILVTHSVRR